MIRWLDRERRIAGLRTLAEQKGRESGFWFERWQKLGLELAAARAQRDAALDSAAEADGIVLEEMAGKDRYRLAWLSARGRAQRCADGRLAVARSAEREIDKVKQQLQIQRADHFAEMKALQDEKLRWDRAAERAVVPPPTVLADADDRRGLYLLEEANERLRDDLAKAAAEIYELRAKYEGNPS